VNYITAASLTDFDSQPQPDLQILAGAFTEGNVALEIGERRFSFQGLPFAGVEVQTIAASIPNTTALQNQQFSPAVFLPQMNDHSVVHFATHAKFVSGQPEESFILFGNGERATLRDIATWSLPDVDLIVLSACRTAVGGSLGNGEEILGFGYQVQRTGARAAIASLWYVDDGGTQVLMTEFYTALQQGLTKAEALRQAQVALITDNYSAPDVSNADETVLDGNRGNTATITIVDALTGQILSQSNDLFHPYYWAPFILIGNGL
jgi:CHAT domain-containing protein